LAGPAAIVTDNPNCDVYNGLTNVGGAFSQEVYSINEGCTYTLTFDALRHNVGTGWAFISLLSYDHDSGTWIQLHTNGMNINSSGWNSYTIETIAPIGTDLVQVWAGTGNGASMRIDCLNLIETCAPSCNSPNIVTSKINAGTDDAEENASGAVNLVSSDLELVYDNSNQSIGLRFNNLSIPQGSTITSARIEFEVDELDWGTTNLNIFGHYTDDAPTFTSSAYNISNRTKTSNSVQWHNLVPWDVLDVKHKSPELYEIVQEIVNRSGWISGNDMAFIIEGTGVRIAESYNGEAAAAPSITIEYCTNTPPLPCPNGKIANQDFENGLNNWASTSNVSITADSHTGSSAALINGGTGGLWQTFTSSPGEIHTIESYIKRIGNSEVASIGIEFFDSSDTYLNGHYNNLNASDYEVNYLSGTAPPNTSYASIIIWKQAGSDQILVDDICVNDWTLPSSTCSNNNCDLAPSSGNHIFVLDDVGDNTFWLTYDDSDLNLCNNGDGTLSLKGHVINGQDALWGSSYNAPCGVQDGWYFDLHLFDKQTWTEFQGFYEVNTSCPNAYLDLDYYDCNGTLTGIGCNAGRVITVLGPANGYRLQIGNGGNSANCDFGLSTWFNVTENGTQINADIYARLDESCYQTLGPEICDNGIDDDGDGLIDNLDTECNPPTIVDVTSVNPYNPPINNNGEITITATGENLEYSIDGGVTYQESNNFPGMSEGDYDIRVRNSDTKAYVEYINNPKSLMSPSPICFPGTIGIPAIDCVTNNPGVITNAKSPYAVCNNIGNSEFDNGADGWDFFVNNGSANLNIDNTSQLSGINSAHADINWTGGQIWHIELAHQGHTLTNGENYYIKFDAKADGPKTIEVSLQLRQAPWTTYWSQYIDLTTTSQTFIFENVSPNVTASNIGLMFKLGLNNQDAYIDNVTFGTESCGPINSTFQWEYREDNGAGAWTNWTAIAGATGPQYDPPVITVPTQYRRQATIDICGSPLYSDEIQINPCPQQFICDSKFYQTIELGGDYWLYQIETQPSVNITPIFNLTQAGVTGGINSTVFDKSDGYIYTLNAETPFNLYRIGSNNIVQNLGPISGFPLYAFVNAGDINASGNIVYRNASDADFYELNISTMSVTKICDFPTLSGPENNIGDIALNPINGKFYGTRDNTSTLVELDLDNCTFTEITTDTWFNGANGAFFINADGQGYGYENNTGNFQRINLTTGAVDLVGQGNATSQTDGCGCDGIAFHKEANVTTAQCCGQFSYTFTIFNNWNQALTNVMFNDTLTDGLEWVSEPYNLNGITIGSTSITGTNEGNFSISNIPLGVSSFTIDVEIPQDYSGGTTYDNQAFLSNLPALLVPLKESDDPETVEIGDPTTINIECNIPTVNLGADASVCEEGEITLSATTTGGVGTLQYTWDNGLPNVPNPTVSPSNTTTYNVTVTDDNGCTATDDILITHQDTTVIFCQRYRVRENDVWNLWTNFNGNCTIEFCEGDGLSDFVFDGGPNINTGWVWTDEDGNIDNEVDEIVFFPNLKVSDSGTYTGTLTNEFGCVSTLTFDVIVHPNAIADAGADQDICSGSSATLTASGGNSYLWNDPAASTSATITVSPTVTTTYIVTVTDNNSCSSTDDVTVTVSSVPVVTASNNGPITCVQPEVILTATPAGMSYMWPGGGTGQNDTVSSVGTYTVTVTDSDGCTAIASTTVTDDLQTPTVDAGNDASICNGSTSVTIGTSPITGTSYQWSISNNNINGATSSTLDVLPATTTTYTLTATGSNGCTASDNVTVTVEPSPTATATGETVCSGESATLIGSTNGGLGSPTYQWQISQGGVVWTDITGATNINYTTPELSGSTYFRLSVSFSGIGCGTIYSDAALVEVELQSIPVAIEADPQDICINESTTLSINEDIATGGLIDYSIWTTGIGSVGNYIKNGNTNENHRIIGTDPWGNSTVVWEARPEATSNADGGWNSTRFDIDHTQMYRVSVWVNRKVLGNDGRFFLGSRGYGSTDGLERRTNGSIVTNPYFYISNPQPNLPEDEWMLVVGHIYPSNDNGTNNHPESGLYTVADGSIGNISNDYQWLPESTESLHRTYLFYCTDVNVRQQWVYPRFDIVDGTEPSIDNLLNGFDANGGLGTGADWQWYSGSCGGTSIGSGTSITVNPSATTTYYVRGEGDCGNSECQSITVTVNTPPTASASNDGPLTCADNLVTLTASPAGATYLWSNGDTNQSTSISTSGLYSVTVTDANGCTNTAETTVTENTTPTPIFCEQYRIRENDIWGGWIDFNDNCIIELCEGDGLSDFQFDGGPNIDTGWEWIDEDANIDGEVDEIVQYNNLKVSDSGTYTGTLTNEFGCVSTLTFDVIVHPNAIADAGADQDICSGSSATLTASGGNSYLWNDPAASTSATITVSPTVTTTYIVTVTDNNSCSSTDDVTVTVTDVNAGIILPPSNCSDLPSIYEATATPGASYLWDFAGGSTSDGNYEDVIEEVTWPSYFQDTTVTVTLTVTTSNGCVSTATETVTIDALPEDDIQGDMYLFGDSDNVTYEGPAANSYQWSVIEGDATIVGPIDGSSINIDFNNQSSTLQLIVTNESGCPDTLYQYIGYLIPSSTCNFGDNFGSVAYNNTHGTQDWSSDYWVENNDDGNPSSGSIFIQGNRLSMSNNSNNVSIQRNVNLVNIDNPTLSFDIKQSGNIGTGDIFQVDVFDGSNWTTVYSHSGKIPNGFYADIDISAYANANTIIRFSLPSGYTNNRRVRIDDVHIYGECNLCAFKSVGLDSENTCEGTCEGVIFIEPDYEVTGPYNLSYTHNGNTTNLGPYSSADTVFISGLCTGTYTDITISRVGGQCSEVWTESLSILETGAEWEHVTHTDDVDNCDGICNGSFTVDANHGLTGEFMVSYTFEGTITTLGPYDFAGDILIDGLCPGTYSDITITGTETGCADIWPTDIEIVIERPQATILSYEDDECQENTGFVIMQINGGSAPYSIDWHSEDGTHTGSTTLTHSGQVTIEGLIGGNTYCFTVTDSNGCSNN
jgi:uncharacterized repeat protein (TIGR01451 family)